MFHNSSQRKYWTFQSEDELEHLRCKANQKFRQKIHETDKVRAKLLKKNINYKTVGTTELLLYSVFSLG